jgi:hypothetical protein
MALDFTKTAAMIILFGFLWRLLTARLAATGDEAGRLASAMSFIY